MQGISNIQTNIAAHTCRFYLADDELDLSARLDEFAKTNAHIARWSFIEGG